MATLHTLDRFVSLPQILPDVAKATQLRCSMQQEDPSDDDDDHIDFPGEFEELEIEWPSVCWEMAGVRAIGAAYLTPFRFILHAEQPPNVPLDIAVADVRSMHLEMSLGAVDVVELRARASRIRELRPCWEALPWETFHETSVDEVYLRCQDLRVVRLIGLQQSFSAGAPSLRYSAGATGQMHRALRDWAVLRMPRPGHNASTQASANDVISLARLLQNPHLARINPGEHFVKVAGKSTIGWEVGEDAREEFFDYQQTPEKDWRVTQANIKYQLCETYPSLLVVPREAPDELLRAAAAARAQSRLPVLTYFHHVSGSALLRCSQPQQARTTAQPCDQQYLEKCRQAVHQHAALVIYDCRSYAAANANRIRGGGQEDPRSYTMESFRDGDIGRATMTCLDLPNIHEMLASWEELRHLVDACDVPQDRWLQHLGDTRWLDHCRRITEAAVTVARALTQRGKQPPACVVVHCSDGWDRTTQVCALAQLLVEPRFRTRAGLAALVEKDWRRFGHRFADRSPAGSQSSPIFVQWLFCVAAVVEQFPRDFEYNSADLMLLADLRICGSMGTFLFNSEKEARVACAGQRQISVWALWLPTQHCVRRKSGSLARAGSSAGLGASPGGDHRVRFVKEGHLKNSVAAASVGSLLLPVTNLKRFILWEWALRFDEVGFSRQKVYSTSAGESNQQRVGRSLVWMLPDSSTAECTGCRCDFSFLRRRHHCRGCGLVFCHACVQWRAKLAPPRAGHDKAGAIHLECSGEKVCCRCFELLRQG